VLVLTDQGRNIEAIAVYIGSAEPARTADAIVVRDEWQRFYSALGDYEANYEQQAYDRARNLRLRFNLANATTEAERLAALEQATRGMTTEEMNGSADRRRTDGTYVPAPSGSAELARNVAIGLGVVLAIVLVGRK
jgi:hypothetical protein